MTSADLEDSLVALVEFTTVLIAPLRKERFSQMSRLNQFCEYPADTRVQISRMIPHAIPPPMK
jgi:hypothetical protein